MSAHSWAKLAAETDNHYRNQVMQCTWGHLQAKPRSTHKGWMRFCQGEDGLFVMIRSDFPTLNGGPWEYQAMNDFVADNAEDSGVVYRFDGVCRISYKGEYLFEGTITKEL